MEWTGSISSIGGCGKTHRIYKKIIVTGSIQTDWVPPVFMSAENRWTAEEKYELVAKVLAGSSYKETAFSSGIEDSLLRQWVKRYKIEGYEGLTRQRRGRPPKEASMKEKAAPAELTPSEREEMIRLRAENERLRVENAVIKKEIALREERWAAQLKAKKQRSSKDSAKKDIP